MHFDGKKGTLAHSKTQERTRGLANERGMWPGSLSEGKRENKEGAKKEDTRGE
jgi:hypothetical protein